MRLFNNEFSLSLAESASLPPPLQRNGWGSMEETAHEDELISIGSQDGSEVASLLATEDGQETTRDDCDF